MEVVGKVESLWRYPVKSMRGEELREAFVGFAGVYGDRVYAFRSSAAPKAFPWLAGLDQEQMLLYGPRYRHPDRTRKPFNLAEAEALGNGVTPVYGHRMLAEDIRGAHELRLLRSARSLTDCRPVSIFSVQTVRKLSSEQGTELDKRRFRANIYIDLESGNGFGEDGFVGRTLRIGARAAISVVSRDARCKIITIDPETARPHPEVMRLLAREYEGEAGIFGAVLAEGTISTGDEISISDSAAREACPAPPRRCLACHRPNPLQGWVAPAAAGQSAPAPTGAGRNSSRAGGAGDPCRRVRRSGCICTAMKMRSS